MRLQAESIKYIVEKRSSAMLSHEKKSVTTTNLESASQLLEIKYDIPISILVKTSGHRQALSMQTSQLYAGKNTWWKINEQSFKVEKVA